MAEEIDCGDEDLEALFLEAGSRVREISSTLSEEQLLEFYGYYKQAVEGPCSRPKPGWFQMTEKQKWQAWSSLKDMDSKEAMRKYVELLNSVDNEWRCAAFERPTSWIHHSSMKDTDEELDDSVKTAFDWVKENNLAKVKSLVISGGDINKVDENNLTLLHWAADRGSLEIVKYLVENFNADVNIKDADGQTPLHYASFCEHNEVVKFLLESGASLSIKDFDGNLPYDVTTNSSIKILIKTFQTLNT